MPQRIRYGLSVGAIVGIVIGSVVGTVGTAAVIVLVCKKYRAKRRVDADGKDKAETGEGKAETGEGKAGSGEGKAGSGAENAEASTAQPGDKKT